MGNKYVVSSRPSHVAEANTRAGEAHTARMKRLTIDVPEELHRRLKVACALKGVNMAEVLRGILEREFPVD
jgi:predicted DNA binding CopG/RHH family protein